MPFERDARFATYADFMVAKEVWERETFQNFRIGPGSTTFPHHDPLRERFKYKGMYMQCVHYGDYETSVKDGNQRVRKNVTSKKIGCQASFYVGARTKKGEECLWIKDKLPTAADHSHPITQELYNFQPGVRKLTDDEERQVKEMRLLGTTSGVVSQALNTKRKTEGLPGTVRAKDVSNANTRQNIKMREGLTEEQIVTKVLGEIENTYPGTTVKLHVDPNGLMECLYFQTPEQKTLLERYPEAVFFDGTYQTNVENYNLWVALVMDKDGVGQPVSFGYLADEQEETMRKFFTTFKEENFAAESIKTIFVDKVKSNIRILEEVFPLAPVLICLFHSMKAFKTKLSAAPLIVSDKHTALRNFIRIAHSNTPEELQARTQKLKDETHPIIIAYYEGSWEPIIERWCFLYRKELQTLGNTTTNRIERFFHMLKAAMRGAGKRRGRRLHLGDSINVLMAVVNYKATLSKYNDYVNTSRVLIMHDFPDANYKKQVGESLTKFAALLIKVQFTLKQKETYRIEQVSEFQYTVVNISVSGNGREYGVNIRVAVVDGVNVLVFDCDCYFSCSLDLPCRHIYAVRESQQLSLFALSDCAMRWHRHSPEADNKVDVFEAVVQNAINGVCDEELDEFSGDNDCSPGQKQPRCDTAERRFGACMRLGKRFASMLSSLGEKQFLQKLTVLEFIHEQWSTGREIPQLTDTGEDPAIPGSQAELETEPAHPLRKVDDSDQDPVLTDWLTDQATKKTEEPDVPLSQTPAENICSLGEPELGTSQTPKGSQFPLFALKKGIVPCGRPSLPVRSKGKTFNKSRVGSQTSTQASTTAPKKRKSAGNPVTLVSSDEDLSEGQSEDVAAVRTVVKIVTDVDLAPTELFEDELQVALTVNRDVTDRIVHVFATMCQIQFGHEWTGFCDTGLLQACHENFGGLVRIRGDMAAGMPCIQPILANNHFTLSAQLRNDAKVYLFNSLSGPLRPRCLLQLYMVYNVNGGNVHVLVPQAQQQTLKSNVCGPLSCAFMAELLFGGNPTRVIYVREQCIRSWFTERLRTGILTACPRRKGRKPEGELTQPMVKEYVITQADSDRLRQELLEAHIIKPANIAKKRRSNAIP